MLKDDQMNKTTKFSTNLQELSAKEQHSDQIEIKNN